MSKKRILRPDEKLLWRKIAKSVTPLSKERHKMLEEEPVSVIKQAQTKPAPVKHQPGKHKPGINHPRMDQSGHRPPAVVDRGSERRMRRGGVELDSRIDLHGMTQAQALSSLSRFLNAAKVRGDRTVLVITGKGVSTKETPTEAWSYREEPGVLRRKLPEWLGYPEIRNLVSGYSTAHAKHGGSGAFYVTMRRSNKAG